MGFLCWIIEIPNILILGSIIPISIIINQQRFWTLPHVGNQVEWRRNLHSDACCYLLHIQWLRSWDIPSFRQKPFPKKTTGMYQRWVWITWKILERNDRNIKVDGGKFAHPWRFGAWHGTFLLLSCCLQGLGGDGLDAAKFEVGESTNNTQGKYLRVTK